MARSTAFASILCALLLAMAARGAAGADSILRFDFADGLQGWSGGFTDYPSGEEATYELLWDHRPLPPEIDASRNGFFITGNNHSDDLFMFLKRRVEGFPPGSTCSVTFRVEFATNAPSDCAGIGGPPGTGVTMKAGAVSAEPQAIPCQTEDTPACPSDGYVLLSVDKGNQATGGVDLSVLGHIGNGKLCPDDTYELKTLGEGAGPFEVTVDPSGAFWIILGTDSGFEGVTALYYSLIEVSIQVSLTFSRGDANLDGSADLSDAIAIVFHLFTGDFRLPCAPTGDIDGNGRIEVTDPVALLGYLFLGSAPPAALTPEEAEACRAREEFILESAAFAEGEVIPTKYTCDGANVSPPLEWRGTPPGTKSLALACVDPDAPSGEFVHWVAWDIPPAAVSLAEGEHPPREGRNGAGRQGYTGPCPPRGGGFHRYFFTLYALDVETLGLATTARYAELQAALKGKVLGSAGVMGRYKRD